VPDARIWGFPPFRAGCAIPLPLAGRNRGFRLAFPGSVISSRELFDLAGQLEPVFRRTVDLGLLSTRNLVYCKEVIAGARQALVFLMGFQG